MNEVFALATDTAWGLACDASSQSLVDKIYSLKGRAFSKPLILFTYSTLNAKKLIQIPQELDAWLDFHWPGDLTIVSKAIDDTFKSCHKESPYLGVRVPNLTSTLKFLKQFNRPLAVTSYNLSEQANVSSKDQLKNVFPNFIPKVIGDMPTITTESAVLKLDGKVLTVLRASDTQAARFNKHLPQSFSIQFLSEQK
ncbi:MAG: L-threonylcarbamoyladenylate synthase [Candidatus Cloacimonetes bacterium]|nr:L-threonylcarbamoyladenylate synthase [Candidatus Cloacimonadota bacterium]